MPEFPEVATVVNYLREQISKKTITNIVFLYPRVVKGISPNDLRAAISGSKIVAVQQNGKNIVIVLTNGCLIAHMRMEGKFYFQPTTAHVLPPLRNISYEIQFSNNSRLWFHDTRRFGTLHFATDLDHAVKLSNVGFDPFNKRMTPKLLLTKAGTRRQMLKSFLLDQKNIAGIGNIYADEVLFRCGIDPRTPVGNLTKGDWATLLMHIKEIFTVAIKQGGTTVFSFHNHFVDGKFANELRVYGRKGLPCLRCHKAIVKIKLAQRGTSFCRSCQTILPDAPMQVNFLCGRICSGKTTIMYQLRRKIRAKLIFADDIINELYEYQQPGWTIIAAAFPSCITNRAVDKLLLMQHILEQPHLLTQVEKQLYVVFFQLLEITIREIITKQAKRRTPSQIMVEIPFKMAFRDWALQVKNIDVRVIYINVKFSTQIRRLHIRNQISVTRAEQLCKFFNAREHPQISKTYSISNNTNNVELTANKIINKIYSHN